MAIEELSRPKIIIHLKDNVQISPNNNEKIDYFKNNIPRGYKKYKSEFPKNTTTLEAFMEIVLFHHNHRICRTSIEAQKTYYKNVKYIDDIMENIINIEKAKSDPAHTFTRFPLIDPTILLFENIIDKRYKLIEQINPPTPNDKDFSVCTLIKRFFEQIISGVILLEHNSLSDSLILWRSLLETSVQILLLHKEPSLNGKYIERRTVVMMRNKLMNASKQTIQDKLDDNASIVKGNVPRFLKERFGWAASQLAKDKDLSLKSFLETLKMDEFISHYTFASLFVHEYLLDTTFMPLTLNFQQYILTIYFKLYEKIREINNNYYPDSDKDIKKLEERLRREVNNNKAAFNDFTAKLQN